MVGQLPIEIVYAILDEVRRLVPDDVRMTLASCALVCRAWRLYSQRYLLASGISLPLSDIEHAVRASVSAHVQRVTIDGYRRSAPRPNGQLPPIVTLAQIHSLISAAPNLRELKLSWLSIEHDETSHTPIVQPWEYTQRTVTSSPRHIERLTIDSCPSSTGDAGQRRRHVRQCSD